MLRKLPRNPIHIGYGDMRFSPQNQGFFTTVIIRCPKTGFCFPKTGFGKKGSLHIDAPSMAEPWGWGVWGRSVD
jgi:hypothetical protein